MEEKTNRKKNSWRWLFRLIGLGMLVYLLMKVDYSALAQVIRSASWQLIILALALIPLSMFIKAGRWWYLLRAQGIAYPVGEALLAYSASYFLGIITPGRVGDLVKAVYVRARTGKTTGEALASVLLDRIYDLYILVLLGSAALFAAFGLRDVQAWGVIALVVLALSGGIMVYISEAGFGFLQRMLQRFLPCLPLRFEPGSWLVEMRAGLRRLSVASLLGGAILTVLAYLSIFLLNLLIARALYLNLDLITVTYAITLGNLVALLPVSVSGIGTRDAVIIAYLQIQGIAYTPALSFSLLGFVIFYIGSGVVGAIAWLIRPAPLGAGLGEIESGQGKQAG